MSGKGAREAGVCHGRNFNLTGKQNTKTKRATQESAVLTHLSKTSWERLRVLLRWEGERRKTAGLLTFLWWSPAHSSLPTAAAIDFSRGRYLAPTDLLSWRFNHIEGSCSPSPLCSLPPPTNKTLNARELAKRRWEDAGHKNSRHRLKGSKHKGAKATWGSSLTCCPIFLYALPKRWVVFFLNSHGGLTCWDLTLQFIIVLMLLDHLTLATHVSSSHLSLIWLVTTSWAKNVHCFKSHLITS